MLTGIDVDFDFPLEGYIFTEVIQSPLDWVSDRGVFIVRVIFALLMSTILGSYFTLEYRAGNGNIFCFRLMNLMWISQCFYMWLISVSLFPHLPAQIPVHVGRIFHFQQDLI